MGEYFLESLSFKADGVKPAEPQHYSEGVFLFQGMNAMDGGEEQQRLDHSRLLGGGQYIPRRALQALQQFAQTLLVGGGEGVHVIDEEEAEGEGELESGKVLGHEQRYPLEQRAQIFQIVLHIDRHEPFVGVGVRAQLEKLALQRVEDGRLARPAAEKRHGRKLSSQLKVLAEAAEVSEEVVVLRPDETREPDGTREGAPVRGGSIVLRQRETRLCHPKLPPERVAIRPDVLSGCGQSDWTMGRMTGDGPHERVEPTIMAYGRSESIEVTVYSPRFGTDS